MVLRLLGVREAIPLGLWERQVQVAWITIIPNP